MILEQDELEIEDIASEKEDEETSAPVVFDILVQPTDFTLEVLSKKISAGIINISPAFQRKYVWSRKQASKLIDSFLIGLPVPPIYLYKRKDSEEALVVDGQQRLKTIHYFFKGVFADDKVFALADSSGKWKGLTYEQLPEGDRLRLNDSPLRAIVIRQLAPDDDQSIFHIFERLNTGGTPLNPQEVRNCVYAGSFNDMLTTINVLPEWRKILGREKPDKRQKDAELVLRCIVVAEKFDDYEKPMKEFLNGFMANNRNPRTETLEGTRRQFSEACGIILQHLGEKPFHLRRVLNTVAAEAVLAEVLRHGSKVPPDFAQRYRRLVADLAFLRTVTKATTDEETFKERHRLAREYLWG